MQRCRPPPAASAPPPESSGRARPLAGEPRKSVPRVRARARDAGAPPAPLRSRVAAALLAASIAASSPGPASAGGGVDDLGEVDSTLNRCLLGQTSCVSSYSEDEPQ